MEIFPVNGGQCLSRKAVHSWVARSLRQQSKYFYAVCFDAQVNRWEKGINVGGGYG
jgi:hypothetical protein